MIPDQAFYDKLHSWILSITKEVMGVGVIRKEILKYFLSNNIPQHNIKYGETFSIGISKDKLYKYLDGIITAINNNKDSIILFTCNNSYGPVPKTENDIIETHYQTFIVQTRERRITMIDPSRRRNKAGIYWPYGAMVVYFYIKSRIHECNFYWLKTTQPCQVKYSKLVAEICFENGECEEIETNTDVFCQSWSLYLQKEALLSNKTLIDIPFNLDNKYDILIDFYQKILHNVSDFKDEFNTRWKGYAKTHPDAKSLSTEIKRKGLDLLDYMTRMKGTDMYYHIDLIKIIPETTINYVNTVSKEEVDEYLSLFIEWNPGQKILNSEMMSYLKTSLQRKSPTRHFIKTPNSPSKSPERKLVKRHPRRSPKERQ